MALLRSGALAMTVLIVAAPQVGAVSVGDLAPRVELAALGSAPVDLAALGGRVVVLDFWASWCAPCVEQLRALDGAAATVSDGDVVIVAASIDDDADAARRFLAKEFPRARFRVAHDPGGEALSSFGADGIPAVYVLDRDGTVRYEHFGPGGASELAGAIAALTAPAPSGSAPRTVD